MKAAPIATALLLLSGCASVARLRDSAPRVSSTSARSALALEQCLAGSLSWIGAPSVIHGENSTELAFGRGFGDSFLLVSLRPSGSGTLIDVRAQRGGFDGHVRRSIENCR